MYRYIYTSLSIYMYLYMYVSCNLPCPLSKNYQNPPKKKVVVPLRHPGFVHTTDDVQEKGQAAEQKNAACQQKDTPWGTTRH